MKIDSDMYQAEIAASARPHTAKAEGGGNFSELLAQAVNNSAELTAAHGVTAPAQVNGGGGMPPLWYQVNGLLDQMERFGQALGDQGLTLKDIEPLAKDLEQKAGAMGRALNAGGDHSLQELARSALAQAQAEVIKFRRGDYV